MIPSQHNESQPVSLRERKKRLAQTTIEEAALRLFQQRGYEQTSIQDIADAVVMSPRTFFRYFASKEEVLFGPLREILSAGVDLLQRVAPVESPSAALTATFVQLANLCQQQRASFLIRYRVAYSSPQLASVYLFALTATEPAICDALCSRLKAATDRNEIRLLVAVYTAAFRVATEIWLEQGATGDLVAVLRENLERLSQTEVKAGEEKSN